jgi:hypothetical protein
MIQIPTTVESGDLQEPVSAMRQHFYIDILAPALIILGFLILGVCYSFVVPPFETPDEVHHYAFARHLARGGSLPVQTMEADGPWEHEGTQAPLYYLMLGNLISFINQDDFARIARENSRANLGDPNYPGNKNAMLYSARALPLEGANLAVHLGRWFSLTLSALTLWFTYRISRQIFPDSRYLSLMALLVAASIPQFVFISASVSNDPLIILMATISLYWMTSLVSRHPLQPISQWDWLVLGVLLALSALSKLQGLGLYALAACVIALLAWRRRDWMILIRAMPLLAATFVLIAGWWYWRNFILYGDFLAANQLLEIEGLRTTPHTWDQLWGELRGLRYSFWGLFGWFSILLPTWIYLILDIIAGVAAITLVVATVQRLSTRGIEQWLMSPHHRVAFCLGTWMVILLAAMAYWLIFAISSQGRLLFPGISAWSIALVGGLALFLKQINAIIANQRRALTTPQGLPLASASTRGEIPVMAPTMATHHSLYPISLLPVGLLACSLYALLVLFPQSYARPAPIPAVPPDAVMVNRVYGDIIELVAVQLPAGTFVQGDKVPVTLYFRKLAETGQEYELFVQLLDQHIKEIGNITTHPGWGKNPTTFWKLGELYADPYVIYLEKNINDVEQIEARLYVGFMDEHGMLLHVDGFEWDIESRTVGYIAVSHK